MSEQEIELLDHMCLGIALALTSIQPHSESGYSDLKMFQQKAAQLLESIKAQANQDKG